ncbi:hypothetical protein HanRHA438_Chr03g0117911 [Helianthus annuus]|nr:hypothetical protein HanRHA438_Chr03g0117911 [Helianthus annuus]
MLKYHQIGPLLVKEAEAFAPLVLLLKRRRMGTLNTGRRRGKREEKALESWRLGWTWIRMWWVILWRVVFILGNGYMV